MNRRDVRNGRAAESNIRDGKANGIDFFLGLTRERGKSEREERETPIREREK